MAIHEIDEEARKRLIPVFVPGMKVAEPKKLEPLPVKSVEFVPEEARDYSLIFFGLFWLTVLIGVVYLAINTEMSDTYLTMNNIVSISQVDEETYRLLIQEDEQKIVELSHVKEVIFLQDLKVGQRATLAGREFRGTNFLSGKFNYRVTFHVAPNHEICQWVKCQTVRKTGGRDDTK